MPFPFPLDDFGWRCLRHIFHITCPGKFDMKGAGKKPVGKPKSSVKEATYTDGRISSFSDILDPFCERYTIRDCPLSSWEQFQNFTKVTELVVTNALFSNFKGCSSKAPITSVTLTGSPVTRYPLYRIMAILAFGDQLTTIDGKKVTQAEKELAKKYNENGKLTAMVRNGVILAKLGPELLQNDDNLCIPTLKEESELTKFEAPLAFDLFFDRRSLEAAEDERMKTIPPNQDVLDQIAIHNCFTDLHILYSKLTPDCKLVPVFEEFQQICERVPKNVAELTEVYKKLAEIDKVMKAATNERVSYLTSVITSYQNSVEIIQGCGYSDRCSEFISLSLEFVKIVNEILSEADGNFDALCESVVRLKDINDKRELPFRAMLSDIEKAVQNHRDKLNDTREKSLERTLTVAKKFTMPWHFSDLAAILAESDKDVFATEIETCTRARECFHVVTGCYANPPSANVIISRMQDQVSVLIREIGRRLAALISTYAQAIRATASVCEKIHAEVEQQMNKSTSIADWVSQVRSSLVDNGMIADCCTDMSVRSDAFFKQTLQEEMDRFDKDALIVQQKLLEKTKEVATLRAKLATPG